MGKQKFSEIAELLRGGSVKGIRETVRVGGRGGGKGSSGMDACCGREV